MVTSDALQEPSPEGGWSEAMITLAQAHVVPPTISALVQPAGVLYQDGTYCPQGALWRRYRPITTQPEMPNPSGPMLEGRWLWGGVLWAHFGHFLVESAARLWALAELHRPVDGVLFIPKRPDPDVAIRGFQTDFIHCFSPDLPIKLATSAMQVEELVVPGQGFGLGSIVSGTPKFRNAIHARFARDIKPDGPDRIYLSRSKLGLSKGGLLGEEELEDRLRAEGYEIFHPQDHSLDVQLARYKAARQVIGADGSALHLYAMVGRPDQQVAMILRRESGANLQLVKNVQSFCKCDPLVINALRTEWLPVNKQRSSRESHGELDHQVIGEELAREGFISKDASWEPVTGRKRRIMLRQKGIREDKNYVESPKFKQQRIRDLRRQRRAERAAQDSQS
ncbi:glycosyltransferase family 61 protein [Epibacterium ulvae]|uniref:glycosyltransferase 61 family protein n=1 Tax=Epibacterium ulvae TaxID=1156985 RepID=UPI001BFC47E2|nr:glycosyltransferase 61 family protein [Epibacterium ulvae]MBT8153626.1 glycosyltransferase family 61 protein [Epibacterium ulvae]